jgi:hypothetical protein
MNIARYLTVQLASFALSLTFTAGPVFAQSAHVLVPADKVQWGPAPPVLPAGAQIAVLEGNPSEKGPVTLRLRFPANYDIPAHWHSMTERLTVLSGALHVGMGDRLSRQASQTLEPGGSFAPGDHASLMDCHADRRSDQPGRAVRHHL